MSDTANEALPSYLTREVTAIRAFRRKMQRTFRQPFSLEEVAAYWHLSFYGRYYRKHNLPARSVA